MCQPADIKLYFLSWTFLQTQRQHITWLFCLVLYNVYTITYILTCGECLVFWASHESIPTWHRNPYYLDMNPYRLDTGIHINLTWIHIDSTNPVLPYILIIKLVAMICIFFSYLGIIESNFLFSILFTFYLSIIFFYKKTWFLVSDDQMFYCVWGLHHLR
jgi:hypothetical protein